MMKNFAFFLMILSSTFFLSCSEEDSLPQPKVDDTDSFKYASFGTDVPILSWTAIKMDDLFEITGNIGGGESIVFRFNEFGDLAYSAYIPNPETLHPIMKSPYDYSMHYFDFSVVATDTDRKIIKVTYSGNLYERDYDLTSHSMPINGSFNLHYTETTPEVTTFSMSAKISAKTWRATKESTTLSENFVMADFNSDDEYKIQLAFNPQTLASGTYNFTADGSPNMILSKYEISNGTYADFNSVGTMVIQKTASAGGTTISGTFTFDASEPVTENVSHVRDGVFSLFLPN